MLYWRQRAPEHLMEAGETPPMTPTTLYISFAPDDVGIAQRVMYDLQTDGYALATAPADLPLNTSEWVSRVQAAVRDAVVVIVITSPATATSPWAQAELSIARDLRKRVITYPFTPMELGAATRRPAHGGARPRLCEVARTHWRISEIFGPQT